MILPQFALLISTIILKNSSLVYSCCFQNFSKIIYFHPYHKNRKTSRCTPDEKSTIVVVENISITEDDMKIYIRIQASHFLWKMVRRIVGTLVEVGRGNLTESDIRIFLKSYTEEPSKYTAPPSGLLLEEVLY